ncbi:MAG: hypothetical protein LAT63_16630 [Marinobacter sp.]|nr:hypothetical protein [Marinobacter sp.]
MKQKNPQNRLFKALAFTVVMALASPAQASLSPQDTRLLSQMYLAIKEQVDLIKKELEELKAVNDQVFQARDYLSAMRQEYEFVQRFDPQRELNQLAQWADGLTTLNELGGKNWQQRWALIERELNNRFERSSAPDAARETGEEAARLDQLTLLQLQMLRDMFVQNAVEPGGSATSKELHQQTATATSMTAALLLEQRIERLEAEAARRERLMQQLEWEHEFTQFLGGRRR